MKSRIRAGLFLASFLVLVKAAESFTQLPFSTRQPPSLFGVSIKSNHLGKPVNGHGRSLILANSASSKEVTGISVEAEDLFLQNCDSDGLMTKQMVQELGFVAELLVRTSRPTAEFWEKAC